MTFPLKDITLLVFDEREHFSDQYTQRRIGKDLFKNVVLIESRQDFDRVYEELGNDDPFLLTCHVFHAERDGVALRGFIHFQGTGIAEDYHIKPILVSAGDSGEVMKNLFSKEQVASPIYLYSKMRDFLRSGEITPYTKKSLRTAENDTHSVAPHTAVKQSFDYAIIAAMYKDEFEQMKDLFEWIPSEDVSTETKRYFVGHLKGQPAKRIIVGIPAATGMVDSAIVATQMLEMFSPKYLLMSGVCGVKSSLEIGDIVVASSVFTFQKGKVSDIRDDDGEIIKVYDFNGNEVDLEHLYDVKKNQVTVSLEQFEVEKGSPLDIHPRVKDCIEPKLEEIADKINKAVKLFGKQKVSIHFEPMACSTMVINKEGYFESNIKTHERKVAAVEMESYGVARATTIANDGKSKWVIFKSGMDNMTMKDDHAKAYAARCSALFLCHLLESGALD